VAAAEATGGTASPRVGPAVFDALVIGAGQAGQAAGYHLNQAGLSFAILEAGEEPGGSWPSYYESLTLFSPSRYSGLPGMPFPGPPESYPTRDEVTAYLRRFAEAFGLPVSTGERVLRAERAGAGFRVLTAAGGEYQARTLIAATGSFARPHRPRFPGQGAFRGRILHAAEYRNTGPFRGKRVVVVGAGDSAVQIAHELAGVAQTTLATRTPIRFVPQLVLGRDLHFWLSVSGLDRLPLGRLFDVSEPGGVVDDGTYAAAVRSGRPDCRPVFSRFTEGGVLWDDGEEEAVDAVLLATGYRPNLEYLRPLGVLREDGRPDQRAGIARSVAGLYFVGLPFQTSFASATLRGVGPDAELVVARARRHLAHGVVEPTSATPDKAVGAEESGEVAFHALR
jgi:putative flavoprotein involved in K+ transport